MMPLSKTKISPSKNKNSPKEEKGASMYECINASIKKE
jgi:hypothetical protein